MATYMRHATSSEIYQAIANRSYLVVSSSALWNVAAGTNQSGSPESFGSYSYRGQSHFLLSVRISILHHAFSVADSLG
jgi:hypothetical protein